MKHTSVLSYKSLELVRAYQILLGGADFSLLRRLQPTSSFLSDPAAHRLKPMLQAEARATSRCLTPGIGLLSAFLSSSLLKKGTDRSVHCDARMQNAAGNIQQAARAFLFPIFVLGLLAQSGDLAVVVSKPVSRTVELPGEFLPFLTVSLHARVAGYVERVLVDRGSIVKQGDVLVELSAPEMAARIAEAQSKAQAAEADRVQADAQLAAVESTYERTKQAAQTPGAIAGNELIQAEKQVDAASALQNSRRQASRAEESAVRALQDLQAYLKIMAPFDGVVTDRMIHPGALVGPGNDVPLLVIEQVSHLRLVVPLPEEDVGGIVNGANVSFQVPAWPERTYSGTIARISHALDQKTRTMAVELDVTNRDGSLAPGMYPTVKWPVRHSRPSLYVPRTSVVTTTERTFVIREKDGRAEWVDVKKGATEGDLVEVMGNLKAGDKVLRRATDETRDGAPFPGKKPVL
jgi:RND family efflux transporter MFP subunit